MTMIDGHLTTFHGRLSWAISAGRADAEAAIGPVPSGPDADRGPSTTPQV
jgi:hypothetical protein